MTPTYSYRHSIETDATPREVWALYSDVSTWPSWDAAAERVTLEGPFSAGSQGTMKFHGQDPLPFRLVEVESERLFVDETPVPDGIIRFRHRLEPGEGGGLRLTHEVEIEGPEPFARELGPMISAGIPGTMTTLAERARERTP